MRGLPAERSGGETKLGNFVDWATCRSHGRGAGGVDPRSRPGSRLGRPVRTETRSGSSSAAGGEQPPSGEGLEPGRAGTSALVGVPVGETGGDRIMTPSDEQRARLIANIAASDKKIPGGASVAGTRHLGERGSIGARQLRAEFLERVRSYLQAAA